jgi:phosphoglycerate dehydrogenase-like enzyme
MIIEGRVDRHQLEACPNLRWVVIPFAGVPAATIQLIREYPNLTLHNLHHNAPQTAETAVTLLLAAAKQTVPMDQALRRNDWTPRYSPEQAMLLEGKICLILGYGEVGRRIGAILRAMGMRVLGIRRNPHGPDEFGPSDLMKLLPQTNVLMIAIPHTRETDGMIGREQIEAMPPGGIIVNVARAQVVDEGSFYEALKSGHLHSAGMDVWYRYPKEEGTAVPGYFEAPPSAKNSPPANYPFGELSTIVMSPHRGGATAGTEKQRVQHLATLIRAAAQGGEVPNQVKLDLGY